MACFPLIGGWTNQRSFVRAIPSRGVKSFDFCPGAGAASDSFFGAVGSSFSMALLISASSRISYIPPLDNSLREKKLRNPRVAGEFEMVMRRDRVRADRRANIMEYRVDGTVAGTQVKLRLFSV